MLMRVSGYRSTCLSTLCNQFPFVFQFFKTFTPGKLIFSLDARVDTARSLGYKAKTVFCVAPIIDYATDSVEYWAAGSNCCGQRADFSCDDVWNPKARSGVVMMG